MAVALLLAAWLAVAAEPAPPAGADAVVLAERVRLAGELRQLAERGVWAGVERAFAALLAVGGEPDADQWAWAAEAARARGDLAAARERLAASVRARPDKARLDQLYALDTGYGAVALRGGGRSLVARVPTVDPEGRAALAAAQAALAAEGRFDGLLPVGAYTFGGRHFEVGPGGPARIGEGTDGGGQPSPDPKEER